MIIVRVLAATDEVVEAFQRLLPQLTTNHAPPSLTGLQELIDYPGSIVLVARESPKGAIIGSATLSILKTPTGMHARLEDVVVDVAQRGKGVGAALTREAIRLARETGADYVALTTNPKREAANNLYKKIGFKSWETNVYRYDIK